MTEISTKFRVVMPSAQPAIPLAERRPRLYLADGTEIIGCHSIEWSDDHTIVRCAFPSEAFTVEW